MFWGDGRFSKGIYYLSRQMKYILFEDMLTLPV